MGTPMAFTTGTTYTYTDKMFKLDPQTLKTLAAKAKAKSPTIELAGTGEIKGVEGSYDATLTKVA